MNSIYDFSPPTLKIFIKLLVAKFQENISYLWMNKTIHKILLFPPNNCGSVYTVKDQDILFLRTSILDRHRMFSCFHLSSWKNSLVFDGGFVYYMLVGMTTNSSITMSLLLLKRAFDRKSLKQVSMFLKRKKPIKSLTLLLSV